MPRLGARTARINTEQIFAESPCAFASVTEAALFDLDGQMTAAAVRRVRPSRSGWPFLES